MLTVISPAKSLNTDPVSVEVSAPDFQKEAISLAKTSRNLTLGGLKDLMSISDDLAKLNRDRFKAFADVPMADQTKAAAFMFDGDTYQGLEVKTLGEDDLSYAQNHLRILSGLYGLLRPLDAIQPYRLEMGSRLKTRRGKNLYDYWGTTISKALNELGEAQNTDTLVNCASQEYFGAADTKALKLNVITPVFMEVKDDRPRIVSFFAKRARGGMARHVVENRVTTMDGLRDFGAGGYVYDADLSEDNKPVFLRDYPTA
ncbi:peroxide stress protein YaaA [Octadecabacter sp. 1_MG-2023]|uniref:peroxide stress protein YaaA n=1 Tax=unclassified Octadecabacter TaxID=196158 RepID=UPI001C0A4FE1|nr:MULTISPECIES: peroxide stress protein YaaA [unclassified Octadecabacter]MBU2992436.1 peroxide stress protein YaaA [Octadecabacter sp. B2R22]MDO6734807.1 peroxide stress protein YaaA [Octadecabacter sp. 1_MG-2023]